MSWFGDVLGFEKFHGKEIFKDLKEQPWRLLTGVDPASTGLWNKVLGRDDKAIVDQMGGATGDRYRDAEAAGIDPSAGKGMQNAAHVLAGIAAAGYGAGALGGAGGGAGAGAGGGSAGGASGGFGGLFGGGGSGGGGSAGGLFGGGKGLTAQNGGQLGQLLGGGGAGQQGADDAALKRQEMIADMLARHRAEQLAQSGSPGWINMQGG